MTCAVVAVAAAVSTGGLGSLALEERTGLLGPMLRLEWSADLEEMADASCCIALTTPSILGVLECRDMSEPCAAIALDDGIFDIVSIGKAIADGCGEPLVCEPRPPSGCSTDAEVP